MGPTTNTISLLGECISTTLPSPDRLVKQIKRLPGSGQPGREWKMAIQNCSVKKMAVTFIPHTIHVYGIFTYIWLIYMVDLWMLWVLFYQKTIIYEQIIKQKKQKNNYIRKNNKTKKTTHKI